MNQQNHDYLQNQVKYLGFGDHLKDALTSEIQKGIDKFSLQFPFDNQSNKSIYTLNFSKSNNSEMYFFNSYELKLNDLSHTFQVNGTKGVTAKEAINLLEGRAVKTVVNFKDKGEQDVFMQLDLDKIKDHDNSKFLPMKYFNEKYGINTAEILNKAPVSGFENYKDDAIKNLEKGNLVKVNFIFKNENIDGFISLNPQYKNLNYYDDKGQTLNSKYINNDISDDLELNKLDSNSNIKR